MAEDFVSVSHLTKRFGDLTVLSDISFSVRKGEFLCVVGPTGCGKTTFLSCLTGAYGVDSGSILLDGEKVDLKKRNIAYIMQEYSTLPWLTVRQNVAFGLTIKKRPRKEAREKVEEVMEKVGLTAFADMYPRQLSASCSGCPSPGPLPWSRSFCTWTSPTDSWILICALNWRTNCFGCGRPPAPR